jgi:hypothetical protein
MSALRADDYYISYSLYVKNFTVINEKLSFSKAMVPFKTTGKPICKILDNSKNINSFIKTTKKIYYPVYLKKEFS